VQPHGVTVEISVSTQFAPQGVRLINPDRLVFDFPGFALRGTSRRIPVDRGPVQEVRAALFQADPPVTRIVVASRQPLNFDLKLVGAAVVIEIAFPDADPAPADSIVPPPVEKKHGTPPSEPQGQPAPPIAVSSTGSRPGAYSMLAKSKALQLADLQALQDKAASGDPEALTMLALAYHAGVLLKQNDSEAIRLLHKAADQHFMAAEESLGIFSEKGVGMSQPTPAEALEWYKRAAQQGSLDAATNIALMYADGIGIPKDPAQAITWFRQAAEKGESTAQYNLGLIYARGEAIAPDAKEAIRWLTAAADQDVVPAAMDLAALYMRPLPGMAADRDQAVHYYEKAADLGSARAEAILGNIFAQGTQGKPDYDQAVKWYRKAAAQGDREGQFGLGVCHKLGLDVPVDLEEARRLFTAAADQGQPGAQYDLAAMYEEGKGAPADATLALHYYQLAADQGLPNAQFGLGRLLARNRESRSDRVAAYKWLMLAQVKESSTFLSDLGKSMSAEEIAEAEREVDNWRLGHRVDRR